jgi:hypothetical protein
MIERTDAADRTEPIPKKLPTDSTDAAEPMDPTERTDPIELIDRIDPVELIESNEPLDRTDNIDVPLASDIRP